jgi:hypothetical protein
MLRLDTDDNPKPPSTMTPQDRSVARRLADVPNSRPAARSVIASAARQSIVPQASVRPQARWIATPAVPARDDHVVVNTEQ